MRLPDEPEISDRPYPTRLESSPWFQGGRKVPGEEVWNGFYSMQGMDGVDTPPFSIYVHVPFCLSRCAYCALYTMEVRENRRQVFDEYLERMIKSLEMHPLRGRIRSPVTVHFGGGTPLSIGLERFIALTEELKRFFPEPGDCEWALETTTSAINEEIAAELKKAGFKRLHIGVQTLDEEVRRRIGRRETCDAVLRKIGWLQETGFSLSVDLIIGFERFTEDMLRNDLKLLFDAGIRMYSICELRVLKQGNQLQENDQKQELQNRRYWNLIWRFMESHSLVPIHLGQFGRSDRDNLYYTHPARDEYCLALGPYSHGSGKNLIYGNYLLDEFYNALRENRCYIEYGVEFSDRVQLIRDLERELLGHRIRNGTVNKVIQAWGVEFEKILDIWLRKKMLEASGPERFRLSEAGSWYVGNMVWQVRELVHQQG